MKNPLHRLLLIVALFAVSYSVLFAAVKKDVKYGDGSVRASQENMADRESEIQRHAYDTSYEENPQWGVVEQGQYGFYLMSLLGDATQYFVAIGGDYRAITASSLKLGQYYGLGSGEVELFVKKIINGQDFYEPALKLKFPKGSKDAIFLIRKNGNKLAYTAYDISLDKIPLNSFAMINFSAEKIGVCVGEKKAVSGAMDMSVVELSEGTDGARRLNKLNFQAFDLTPHSQKKPQRGTLVFPKNYRYIMLFFEFSDSHLRTPVRIINQGPRTKI